MRQPLSPSRPSRSPTLSCPSPQTHRLSRAINRASAELFLAWPRFSSRGGWLPGGGGGQGQRVRGPGRAESRDAPQRVPRLASGRASSLARCPHWTEQLCVQPKPATFSFISSSPVVFRIAVCFLSCRGGSYYSGKSSSAPEASTDSYPGFFNNF